MFLKTVLSIYAVAIMVLFNSSVSAIPITQARPHAYIDNHQGNPFGLSDNIYFNVSVNNVTPSGNSGTSATATNGATTVNLTNHSSDNRPDLFSHSTTYANAQNNSLLDPWEITLTNGADQTTRSTLSRESTQVLGFAQNLAISGSGLAPTISWALPSSGPAVTRMRYEVWNLDTQVVISGNAPVKLGATEISANLDGLGIVEGTNYAVRIIPEQHDSSGAASRSSNWMTWQATVGQAEGSVLSLTTGSPAGVSQSVDTPSETFYVDFDYLFTTTTGALEFFLDGVLIGTPLVAPSVIGNDFFHATFKVDDPFLFNRFTVPLTLTLNGPTGSNILIDNLIFPDLINGNFAQGLNQWAQIGPGQVSVNPVPEPASILLFVTGIIGLTGIARKKR